MIEVGKNVKVKIYRDTNGHSFPVVVRNGVFPACLYLNAYLNGNHNSPLSIGKKGVTTQAPSLNTRIKYAYELKLLYCYFADKGINLVDRVADSEFLSRVEVEDFVRACKLYADDSNSQDCSAVVSITDKRIRDAIYATANSHSQVSAHTFRQRLIRLRSYIEYLYVCHHYDQADTENKVKTDDKFRVFQLYINKFISGSRKDNTITKDPFESVISTDKFFELLEIIRESSPKNPFKSSKLRNQIIMQILIDTGVRVGAVLKLKISDLVDDWDNPRFLITRTPDDATDTRRMPAANKTKALSASVSSDLMKLIKLYVSTVRASHSNAHEHDFVFISEKGVSSGQPISYNAINKLVGKFGDAFGTPLHPHKLRHKWNEVFTEKAEEAGYEAAQIEDMRKYSMGWVENSKMAQTYNEFKLAVKVQELSAKNQSKSVPSLGGASE
ncbi:site-specific integrase [Endozoicomonas euniceicola]|uniref:Site-specific integrase n=1 Tax=Endozoicomonas euniceicola TaxID=1234143 RepID=A0ABY6GPD1_9GAMM|nr:site-specific integrase [Endozoicomonas euniceicola]UYM14602.1 site-specific integrase [Endozoicomonas euniceicola]